MVGGAGKSVRGRLATGFVLLPPALRRSVLHTIGRYAPWESEFDFTPPPLGPGEETGPPDFVGIGAQKAGTTWWYRLISTHPDIFSPEGLHKERHFFDRFGSAPFATSEIERYHGWFPRRPGSIAGEWTPDYLSYPWVAPLLKRAAPATRLLVLLRDPVERFRSGLAHQARMGAPFDADATAGALRRGFYHHGLVTWFEHFDPSQFLVLQYERCLIDADVELDATFRFLGLASHRVPETEKRLRPRSVFKPAPGRGTLSEDVTRRLVELYAPDVASLAARLPGLDLRLWPNFAHLGPEPVTSPPGPADDSSSPTRRA